MTARIVLFCFGCCFPNFITRKSIPYVHVAHNIFPSRERSYSSDPISNLSVDLIFFNTLETQLDAWTCHSWATDLEENPREWQCQCSVPHPPQRKAKLTLLRQCRTALAIICHHNVCFNIQFFILKSRNRDCSLKSNDAYIVTNDTPNKRYFW